MNPSVKERFDAYPEGILARMLELRDLIYDVAESTEGVGQLEETLKWGEPAYLTRNPKSGTTLRIDWKEKNPDCFSMYVSCNTTLVDSFRSMFAEKLTFEGNRAVVFKLDEPIPEEAATCIRMVLRYHLDKNSE